MSLDLAVGAILAAFAVRGLLAGAVKQATHWTGLLTGYLVAWPLAGRIAPSLAPRLSVAPVGVEVSLAALAYLVFYAAGAYAFQRLVRTAFGPHENKPWDRWGGAALGLVSGATVLYAALSAALFFEKPLTKAFGPAPAGARGSRAAAIVARHNLFAMAAASAARGRP